MAFRGLGPRVWILDGERRGSKFGSPADGSCSLPPTCMAKALNSQPDLPLITRLLLLLLHRWDAKWLEVGGRWRERPHPRKQMSDGACHQLAHKQSVSKGPWPSPLRCHPYVENFWINANFEVVLLFCVLPSILRTCEFVFCLWILNNRVMCFVKALGLSFDKGFVK